MNKMRRGSLSRRSTTLVLAALTSIALFGRPAAAQGPAAPTTVYVFNGGADNEGKPGDLFATGAQGWIFSALGLLDANGKPPTLVGDDLKQGNTVVGKVLRDAMNKIIGYESADGTKRAYNVDTSATTRDAWNALANTGRFVIAKHGRTGGGGITLDGGRMYDGFKQQGAAGGGTGAGLPAGPYELPAKPGGMVHVNVNGCYSSLDPPGGVGSVTGSAGGVGGVTGTSGNPGIVYKGTGLGLGGTQMQIDAAMKKLQEKAKAAGVTDAMGKGDVATWLARLAFKDQYSTVEATIMGTGATFSLSYVKDTSCPSSGTGGGGCYYEPLQTFGPSGGTILFQLDPMHPAIELTFPVGSIPVPDVPIQLTAMALEPPGLPPGLQPMSPYARFGQYGLDPFVPLDPTLPPQLTLDILPLRPIGGVFEVDPNGTLHPVPFAPGTGDSVTLAPDHAGIFVVIEQQLGQNYCPANPNSTGVPAQIVAAGSPFVVADDLRLTAHGMPANAFGFFLASTGQIFVPNPGGSQGNLCIGPNIGRGVGGVIFNSGDAGRATVAADLGAMPTPNGPVSVQAGDTWFLQGWFRDSVGGAATSNLTDAVRLTFM